MADQFNKIKSSVWIEVSQLALSNSDQSFPIQLHSIASAAGIESLRIEPLFSTAGLEVGGKVIWINTEATGNSFVAGTRLAVSDPRWNELTPPVRFSIAHEVVHALFARLNKRMPKTKIAELEAACNEIARVMLLPAPLVLVTLKEGLNAFIAADLITRARVSADVFLYRLALPDVTKSLEADPYGGVLAVLRESNGIFRVVAAHAWGAQARTRFGGRSDDFAEDDRLRTWGLDPRLTAATWQRDQYSEPRRWVTSQHSKLPCELLVIKRSFEFLLSLKVLGPAERHGDDRVQAQVQSGEVST